VNWRAVGCGTLAAAVFISLALFAILRRHIVARENFNGALVRADTEHVDVHREFVDGVFVEHAIAVVAIDQHEAHRVYIDFIRLRSDVVLLLQKLRAVGDNLLAGGAEFADGSRQFLKRG